MPKGVPTPPAVIEKILRDYRVGFSMKEISTRHGVAYDTVKKHVGGLRSQDGQGWRELREEAKLPPVKPYDKLSDEAKHAWDDFRYFRQRIFGRIPSPWQEDAGSLVVDKLDTEEKEYLVINAPPGGGKSTLFTHDIPAWVTTRNRAIRGLMGHRAQREAQKYTGRLRRTFERKIPVRGDDQEKARGLALDAETTLLYDFGRFKPQNRDVWRSEEFIVAQQGNVPIEDKEMTWTAYGMDSAQIGNRFNFIIWDDLVTSSTTRTLDQIEKQREWYQLEAETRLEPGGLFILQGQRLSANDLYRFALDMPGVDAEELMDTYEEIDLSSMPKKYHHIVYKAHYEDLCDENHGREAKPWPDGCLLDPRRLPWRELLSHRRRNPGQYQVVYQQEDVDPEGVLVPPIWIEGGIGFDGEVCPGCWDDDRGIAEIPRHADGSIALSGDLLSIATADPSPTKYWSIQWILYHPDTEQHFIMDMHREKMEAPDFIDWLIGERTFVGLMEDWQQRSINLGIPITHWIVEANAAQRFMLQYNHVRTWMARHGVSIIPHQTTQNKSDPELGIHAVQPHFHFGRVRLPGSRRTGARAKMQQFVYEHTHYTESGLMTDDCVMAFWFYIWNLPNIYVPRGTNKKQWRPSWLGKKIPA